MLVAMEPKLTTAPNLQMFSPSFQDASLSFIARNSEQHEPNLKIRQSKISGRRARPAAVTHENS